MHLQCLSLTVSSLYSYLIFRRAQYVTYPSSDHPLFSVGGDRTVRGRVVWAIVNRMGKN